MKRIWVKLAFLICILFIGLGFVIYILPSFYLSGKREVAEFSRINYYVSGTIFLGLGLGFMALMVLGVREARRLSGLEERNRLAMELHNGLAQSLVNVVIRLELCQKLFENNSIQATDELNKLKENARELVKDARRAIANLKEA